MGSFRQLETQPAAGGTYRRLDVGSTPRKANAREEASGALATFARAVPGLDEVNDGLYALGKTVSDFATGKTKFGSDQPLRDNLTQARSRSKAAADDFAARHPHVGAATQGLGLALTAIPALLSGGATAAAPIARTGLMNGVKRFAAATGKGGLVGALSGDLTGLAGEGTLEDRANAGNRAILPAAALGAAMPLAAAGASAGRRAVVSAATKAGSTTARLANRVTGGQLLDPRREAALRLREALEKDGLGPNDILRGLSEWQRSGAQSPALLDLAGENTRALLRSAASKPGAGRNLAVDYANQVTGDLQGNAIARTRQLTPDRRPASAVQDELKLFRRRAADEMYPAFAEERVPVGDDVISAADGGAKWLQEAHDLAVVSRHYDVANEIKALADGAAGQGGNPASMSAGALDYIRRAMRDAGDEAFRAGRGQMGGALKDRAGDLETALMDVPGFDAARNTYRGFSQQLDAIDAGKGVLNQVPDDFAGEFAKLPLEHGGIGGRQALEEAIGRPTEGATGTLNRIATSTNTGRNLETLYGPEDAQLYREAIGHEIDRVGNARFVSPNTGSQTALRATDDALVDLPPLSKLGLLKAAIDKVRRGVSLTEPEREALVQIGTSTVRGPDDLPQFPTRPEPMRLSPADRMRILQALVIGEGGANGQQGGR